MKMNMDSRVLVANRLVWWAVVMMVGMSASVSEAGEKDGTDRGRNSWRMAKHLTKSHTVDVVKSPLSATGRLVGLVADTGIGWVKRLDIRLRRAPLLNRKDIPELAAGEGMDLEEWSRWLDEEVSLPQTGGEVDFLIDGPAFFERLDAAIEEATNSILMQTYIFDNDDVAQELADRLKDRSAEVDVRVLYDGLGSILAQSVKPSDTPADHVAPRSMHVYLEEGDSKVKVRRIQNAWFAGDHVKSTVIDQRVAFMGGMNIGREYRYDWHDMMVELRGPVADLLERVQDRSWRREGLGDLEFIVGTFRRTEPLQEGAGIHLLRTLPGNGEIARVQLEAIRRARHYIYIQNAYFADDEIVHELCKARKRGVDVRVILPNRGNHGLMQRSNLLSMNKLVRNGVRVFHYPGMSHVKAAVFDGWACFGTANYDKLSFRVNKELNIGTFDKDVVDRLLKSLFLPDMDASEEVTTKKPVRFVDHVIELVADEV